MTAIPMADAIAELSAVTGDEDRDFLNRVTIDHLQRGWQRAVRLPDGTLGLVVTQSGIDRVRDILGR